MSPFKQANNQSALEVARILGLRPSKSGAKHPCVRCSSSDGMHIYEGPGRGAYCYACGQGFSCTDLASEHLSLRAFEAAKWVCDQMGLSYEVRGKAAPGFDASGVLEHLWSKLTLDGRARTWIEGRGVNPEICEHLGWRTWPGSLLRHLIDAGDDEALGELVQSGLAYERDGVFVPHPHYKKPSIFIPYWKRGTGIDTARFRTISEETPKILSLRRTECGIHSPSAPYAAWGAYDAVGDDGRLYVVEGELDCVSMSTYVACVSTPGASVWHRSWCVPWVAIEEVVIIGDGDHGGDEMIQTVVKAAAAKLGASWVQTHVRAESWPDGMDATDLLKAGHLRSFINRI